MTSEIIASATLAGSYVAILHDDGTCYVSGPSAMLATGTPDNTADWDARNALRDEIRDAFSEQLPDSPDMAVLRWVACF